MAFNLHQVMKRRVAGQIERDLARFPVVLLVGPRQCGKTTLAREIAGERPSVYLDLERPSDLAKLADPEAFLQRHAGELVCLDEVQRAPELFGTLRSLVDAQRRPGRFLLLGSASPEALRQSSESLAGRVATVELGPFTEDEVRGRASPEDLWLRGGFPDSLLAADGADSLRWREQFVRTFLERDLPQLGFRVPAATMGRFWSMCAHLHGRILNLSELGRALGESHTTARRHLDALEQGMLVRTVPPLHANLGKRLVKSPRLYVRDTGLLHAILGISDRDALDGHPIVGASWEGFVVEQCVAVAQGWRASFYRTAKGDEIDLVLERGRERIGIEAKASRAPAMTRGFWTAREDLGLQTTWVVAPVDAPFPLGQGVEAVPIGVALDRLR